MKRLAFVVVISALILAGGAFGSGPISLLAIPFVHAAQAPGPQPAGGATQAPATAAATRRNGPPPPTAEQLAQIEAGNTAFQQSCAFCHGRDAGGGESGPDLTRSKVVLADVNGDQISTIVHNGRGRMPKLDVPDKDLAAIVAFLHAQQLKAQRTGQRKGVDPSDLLTGNAAEGKRYFETTGGCVKCHSATGDLAHVAAKYEGLQLLQQMLYPREAKSKAAVTLRSGEKLQGTVELQDEFTLGIKTADGVYHSWPTGSIEYTIDAPQEAHAALFPKYSDTDIHNLYAYVQSLR